MNKDTKPKLLIISLDGATFDAIRPLAENGEMPNIKRLMDEGLTGDLESTEHSVTPVAWTSFMTGKLPGKHGILDFRQYNRSTGEDTFANSESIRGMTIWQILSANGVKVGVINLPMTYPPYEVNGFMISGFDTPSIESKFTYPDNLKDLILELIPDYDFIFSEGYSSYSDAEFKDFTDGVIKAFRQRAKLTSYLMTNETWDVLMVQFQNVDVLQHKAWSYVDPSYSGYLSEKRRNQVIECYRELDRIIGNLVEKAREENATVMIISDHGFGLSYGAVYPNQLLMEWGFLKFSDISENEQIKELSLFVRFKKFLWNNRISFISKNYRNLSKIRAALSKNSKAPAQRRSIDKFRAISLTDELSIDFNNTKAFAATGILCSHVFLNIKSDSETSIEDYDEMIELLIHRFSQVTESTSGDKIFTKVVRGSEIYGELGDHVPDIVLVPKEGYTASREIGDNFVVTGQGRRGQHRKNGIFIAFGKDILQQKENALFRITDIAPTIFAMYDIPIPSDIDGRVMSEIFVSPPKFRIEQLEDDCKESKQQSAYTDQDLKKVEERLRNIGYMS